MPRGGTPYPPKLEDLVPLDDLGLRPIRVGAPQAPVVLWLDYDDRPRIRGQEGRRGPLGGDFGFSIAVMRRGIDLVQADGAHLRRRRSRPSAAT
jgi:hypothetical protein